MSKSRASHRAGSWRRREDRGNLLLQLLMQQPLLLQVSLAPGRLQMVEVDLLLLHSLLLADVLVNLLLYQLLLLLKLQQLGIEAQLRVPPRVSDKVSTELNLI